MEKIDFVNKIKKKPIAAFVIIGVIVIVIYVAVIKKKAATTEEATTYSSYDETQPTTGSTSGMIGQAQAETLGAASSMVQASQDKMIELIAASNDQLLSKIQGVESTVQGQSERVDSSTSALLDKINQSFETVSDRIERVQTAGNEADTNIVSKIDTIRETQVIPKSETAKTAYDTQIEAYTKIKTLGSQWTEANAEFMKDKVISPSERASLDAIHMQAENIGIAAGFGAGGPSGALRKIPVEVKTAVDSVKG